MSVRFQRFHQSKRLTENHNDTYLPKLIQLLYWILFLMSMFFNVWSCLPHLDRGHKNGMHAWWIMSIEVPMTRPDCSRRESSLCPCTGAAARWVLAEIVSFPCKAKQPDWLAGIARSPPRLAPWQAVLAGRWLVFEAGKLRRRSRKLGLWSEH